MFESQLAPLLEQCDRLGKLLFLLLEACDFGFPKAALLGKFRGFLLEVRFLHLKSAFDRHHLGFAFGQRLACNISLGEVGFEFGLRGFDLGVDALDFVLFGFDLGFERLDLGIRGGDALDVGFQFFRGLRDGSA